MGCQEGKWGASAPQSLHHSTAACFRRIHLRDTSLSGKADPSPGGQGHLGLKEEVQITWTRIYFLGPTQLDYVEQHLLLKFGGLQARGCVLSNGMC